DITPKSKMDMLSSIAYACGYLGNILAFAVCMSIVILAQLHIIPISIMTACKITFVITAIWCTMFSIPIMKNVKQIYGIKKEHRVIVNSIKRLGSTFKNIGKHKNLVIEGNLFVYTIENIKDAVKVLMDEQWDDVIKKAWIEMKKYDIKRERRH
ncbi:MFS transporter, partial [Escherichia coli]|nr:MFS transporter [Escherichia coli]